MAGPGECTKCNTTVMHAEPRNRDLYEHEHYWLLITEPVVHLAELFLMMTDPAKMFGAPAFVQQHGEGIGRVLELIMGVHNGAE